MRKGLQSSLCLSCTENWVSFFCGAKNYSSKYFHDKYSRFDEESAFLKYFLFGTLLFLLTRAKRGELRKGQNPP